MSSSEFGRRPSITRQSLQAIQQETQEPAGGEGPGFFSSPLWSQLRGMLIGVGIVGLLIGVYITSMKGFGRALDRHWATNAGYPSVEDAYQRSASKDAALEVAHNDCKSRSDFVGRNTPRTMKDVVSGDDITIGRAVTYLSCLATEKPERFCQAAQRTHLIAAVRDYYRLMGKMREERVLMNSGPFAGNRNALTGGASREPFASTPAATGETDPRVANALKALVRNGYVSRRDLVAAPGGWPSDLDLVLRGVEPNRTGCG